MAEALSSLKNLSLKIRLQTDAIDCLSLLV